MNCYVLPNLSQDDKDRITRAGVHFGPWDYPTRGSILITGRADLETILREFSATATESPTEYQGMIQVVLVRNRVADATRADAARAQTARETGFAPMATAAAAPAGGVPAAAQPATYETGPLAESRNVYIRTLSRTNTAQEEAARRRVMLANEVKAAQTRLIETARRSFDTSKTAKEELRKKLEEEFTAIAHHAKVVDFRPVTDGFVILTEKLFATNGTRHEVGAFLIIVNLSASNPGVSWYNRTRRVNGVHPRMNAPYVLENGSAADDEMRLSTLELIGRCEYASLVDIAIQYIENVQPENPLNTHLNQWPLTPLGEPPAQE